MRNWLWAMLSLVLVSISMAALPDIVNPPAAMADTATFAPAASSDDAEERSLQTNLGSGDLDITHDGKVTQKAIGLRLPAVAVPQFATVTSARLQFTAVSTNSGSANFTIYGQDSSNAAPFTSADNDITNRRRTTNKVSWTPPAWNKAGERGAAQRTPNLAAVVQEIVNRDSWDSRDPMAFIITGTGRRNAEAWDRSSSGHWTLSVEWTSPTPTATPTTTSPSPTSTETTTTTTTTTPTTNPAGHYVNMGAIWHAVWGGQTDTDRARELDLLAANGVKWLRVDIGWASLEPQDNVWDKYWLDSVNRYLDMARARGFKVLGMFWLTPGWANNNAGSRVAPTNAQHYADALRHVVGYYGTKVDSWQVWNEPDSCSFFSPCTEQAYFNLLKPAYTTVKATHPGANVVLGGPQYVDTSWLSNLYQLGAKPYFDTMSTHPYMSAADLPPDAPATGSQYRMMHVDELVKLMALHGDSAKPIWFTEFGWSSHANTSTTDPWALGVTEAQQADYLKRTVDLIKARWPQVTHVFWYNSRNKVSGNVHQDNFGLMTREFAAKPVLSMFKTVSDAQGPPPQ